MKRLIGAVLVAVVAAGFTLVGSASSPAAAAQQVGMPVADASDANDFSARRHVRRHHRTYAHRPYHQPHYYARPTYYRPYPYSAPVPFFLGIGFGPSWW